MKKIALLLCVLAVFAYAQNPVYSEPAFATKNDSIVIYYDATLGNQALKDFTGDVYAHTGLITKGSENAGDWKYVWMAWPGQGTPVNTAENKLTRISTNLYKLTIGNIFDYYSCPEDTVILEMAFVFRNSTGTIVGKDAGDTDIFLPLYEDVFSAAIFEPKNTIDYGIPERSPIIRSIDDSSPQNVIVGTNDIADNIALFLNDTQIASATNTDSLGHSILAHTLTTGKNYIYGVANKGAEIDTTDAVCIIKYDHNLEALPSGYDMGIKVSPSTLDFALFAPGKEVVYVIGDFNNWEVDPAYQMKKHEPSPDSTTFWLSIPNTYTAEQAFQYFVDGEIRVADPYSQLILDPWNDQYISDVVYPDLKAYPEGKTELQVGVVDPTPDPFSWTDQNWVRPGKDNLVIYECLIRDFTYQHSYQSLIDKMDYFKELGITAIELMPVCEFQGNESWGYNPSFYLALDKYYGTAQKFKEFINTCHENGIAVILDVVYNHATGDNPMVRLYNEGTWGAPTSDNPWFNTVARHPYNVFNDANHESVHTKYMLDRANKFWLEEYHVDGYRFDLSKGFTQTNSGDNVSYWGQYDASRIAILKRMADKIWEVDPSAYVILEHFGDNNEEIELANHGMMLWGNANHNYSEASMGYLASSDLGGVFHANRGWSWRHLVGYMESHDEERITYKNKEYGNSSGTYNIKVEETAWDRMELAAVFLLSYPGPKMIWQFGELGYSYSIDYNDRTGNKPIRWDYVNVEGRHDIYELYSAMNYLRKTYPVFSAASSVDQNVGNNVAVKRLKLSQDGIDAIVLGNFDVVTQNINPGFTQSGDWYEFFQDDTLTVVDISASISLAPGEYRIYTDQKLTSPFVSLDNIKPRTFELKQNYPNPFNPTTTISYVITADSEVELSIFDINGRKINTLVSEHQDAGEYSLHFDASGLASGVYFYKLTSGRHVESKKMLLLK